jgi:REP element-mobilizing transposase RayT
MPSYARTHQLKQSLIYHVINRGNFRDVVFHDENDFVKFKEILSNYSQETGLKIYHWVLMSNHYHLCLELDNPEKLSSIMAGIARSYVHYHHKKYNVSGYLWQGRFKAQPIQKEQYLLACGRYIERNPVRVKNHKST